MKRRVLFVDDDTLLLQGLQRLLRPMRKAWDMEFVESGALALERLRLAPCDVIVSDMMMPGMNGVQLLQRVRAESPRTVRLVLSGHTAQQLAIQCVGVAHQFLAKPCALATLRSTIDRVTGLGFAAHNENLLKIAGRLEGLPSLPAIYSQLVAVLENPSSSTDEIGTLIERDLSLTAHLLKIVNSAFFGLAQRVNKLADAVAYVGLDTLKALVLTAGLFENWTVDSAAGFSPQTTADHCQKVGAAARAIAGAEHASRELREECFIAGLLHDIGKLILAFHLPRPSALGTPGPRNSLATESATLGVTHAEVGSYLLGLWGLPPSMLEAIRLHHAPRDSKALDFSALTAVHVADHLVPRAPDDPPCGVLDEAYLASLGLLDRLPAWQAVVAQLLSSASPAVSFS